MASSELDDEAFLRCALRDGVRDLGGGRQLHGLLTHRAGDAVVVDLEEVADGPAPAPGTRLSAETLLHQTMARGETSWWTRLGSEPWEWLIATPFAVGETTYCLSYAGRRPQAAFDADDVAYVETVAALCATRLRRHDETRLAERHAQRLETLGQIAATSGFDDEAYLRVLLDAASRVIREGQRFQGALFRVEGEELVAVVSLDVVDELALRPGARFRRDQLVASAALEGEPTVACGDLGAGAILGSRRLAYRTVPGSFIGTSFRAGETTYVISFISSARLADEFTALDRAFVETLASLCATRLRSPDRGLAERHERRLEALWQIAATNADADERFLRDLLDAASAVIRDRHPFSGSLFRIDGEDLVVEMALDRDAGPQLRVGMRLPIDDLLAGAVVRGAGTTAFADVRRASHLLRSERIARSPWRAFIGTSFEAAGSRYVIGFVSLRPLDDEDFSALDRAFVETLAALCAGRMRHREQLARLQALQQRLDDETRVAERHVRRLETLWQIGATTSLADEAYLEALLGVARHAIREGRAFRGGLLRLDGEDLVLEVASPPGHGLGFMAGARRAVDDLISGELLGARRTVAYPDLAREPRLLAKRSVREGRLRAFIGTSFGVGTATYAIAFLSTEPLAEEFSPLDLAFVETLGALCATRLHQRAQLDRLRYSAEHDALTGIPNRATFRARGFAALRRGGSHALAVLDLDGFRSVNDTLGHQTGDALLVEVAAMLTARAGNDVVARTGGDEFAILISDVERREDVERRVARYLEGFREPFGIGDREGKRRVALTASAGVALAPEHATNFEQLLARADAAVYAAKRAGRWRCSFFDPRVEEEFEAMRRLHDELSAALAREELVLHFQPQLELGTGRVAGVEALVRWNHPERGLLEPESFLSFAQHHGMMTAIGAWVVREAVRLSAEWRRGDPTFRVWLNLSARELADPSVVRPLRERDEDLRGLGIEITETDAMQDVEQSLGVLAEFREAGVQIGLDDFGTGYSSLAHLKRLPLDVVKIDRSFVAGLPSGGPDEAIVDAVVGIGRRFGFRVIAEGVESAEQLAWLERAGCDLAQGYRLARPMPAAAFEGWLAERATAAANAAEC